MLLPSEIIISIVLKQAIFGKSGYYLGCLHG
jgi:hypothetical protein